VLRRPVELAALIRSYDAHLPSATVSFILRVRRHRLGERSYRRVLTATVLVPMWTCMPRPSTNFARARPTLFAM